MATRHSLLSALSLLLLSGGAVAQTAADAIDPTIPQEERICDIEIAEVEEMRTEAAGDFEAMQEAQLDRLMTEARNFCDDGNEVMAAIRLEAAKAMIEVVRPPSPPGGEMLEEEATEN